MNNQSKHKLKIRDWKTILQANNPSQKAGMAILVADGIDFRLKRVRRGSRGHFLLAKGYEQQEEIMLLNIYAPNQGPAKYLTLL